MYRLDNTVQHYAWGSRTYLPELLGVEPDDRPFAELWMGTHPAAPSRVDCDRLPSGAAADGVTTLHDLLLLSPEETLGPRVLERFGAQLPYLFKILAIDRPLSLQVHPSPELARAGFDREDARGLPLDAPDRSFPDTVHKPELVVAVTPFEAMVGFRDAPQVLDLLEGLGTPTARTLGAELRGAGEPGPGSLRAAFGSLLSLPPNAVAQMLGAAAAVVAARPDDGATSVGRAGNAAGTVATRAPATAELRTAAATALRLAQWYPGDPACLAPFFLNLVALEPGEGIFVPAGTVHAYLDGCAAEVAACSDNVLRGGLTTKHVDVPGLLDCTVYTPAPADVLRPRPVDGATTVFRAGAPEFAVALTRLSTEPAALPDAGPRIALCLDGSVDVVAAHERLRLTRGQSVLLPHGMGPARAHGTGLLVTAFVPDAG